MSNENFDAWRRFKLDMKTWIALAGVAFGVVQFAITLHLGKENTSLQQALQEEERYRVGVSYYYRFNHDGLAQLSKRLHSMEQGRTGPFSLVEIDGDNQRDDKGRLGGWSAFQAIHSRAEDDPEESRNQLYWFMAIKNRGTDTIDSVHIRFLDGNEEVDAIAQNIQAKEELLFPLEVFGLHTNLTRTKTRRPIKSWFFYQSQGRQARRVDIVIPPVASLRTTDIPGGMQALPIF